MLSSNGLVIMMAAIVIGLLAQGMVKGTYRRWSRVPLQTGRSGAEVARAMLDSEGLHHVGIERIEGELTDHFDPRANVLRLSRDVYEGRSVAAAGVAAHEAGHAVQHARRYVFAQVRQVLVPTAQFGSQAAGLLIIAGLFIGMTGLVWLGILAFAGAVLFQIVTLPVEFDASRRAMMSLSAGNMLPMDQTSGARRVLTAAALTYVAATLVSIVYLLYYIGLARRH